MASYQELFREMRQALRPLYDEGESSAIARLFLEQATGLSYTRALAQNPAIPPVTTALVRAGMAALQEGKPVQQVLGRTTFRGHSFRCDARALIPRPETEELVGWVVADWQSASGPVRILDVGTGSGCIAVSLALEMPQALVSALDVSADALELARSNAAALGAAVSFRQDNFLTGVFPEAAPCLEVLVSNPPYIPERERESLHPNVRDHEPHLALFVPDADALVFYRRLARVGARLLAPGGAVYCETHRDHAGAVAGLFRQAGYAGVVVREDAFGAPRMVRAFA